MISNFNSLIKEFLADEEATVTVEFIMIMPVLVFWWIGSVVFFDVFEARAGAARVSHTIADIISRQTDTNNAFIDDLLVLQNRMLPKEPTGIVRISDIRREADTTLTVVWSYSTGSPALTEATIPLAQIPTMSAGQHILLVDTSVPYVPLSDWIGITAQTWENRIFTNARFVSDVPNTDFP